MLKKNTQFNFLKQGFTFEKDNLKDTRVKKDRISRLFYAILVLSLLLFGLSLFYFMSAMPPSDNFFSRFFKVKVNYSWNIKDLAISAKICLLLFVVSIIGVLIKLQRLKRKGDKFDYFNVFTAIYALCMIVFYLIKR